MQSFNRKEDGARDGSVKVLQDFWIGRGGIDAHLGHTWPWACQIFLLEL